MRDIRAAAVQFQHAPGDKAANVEIIRAFVHDAAAQRVNLIAFPEMCLTGYWHVRNLSREAIEALFALPFNDLLFQAQQVHRANFDANAVQLVGSHAAAAQQHAAVLDQQVDVLLPAAAGPAL